MRKPESPSKYIQSEARKVSTELEKVMEEAFNRSSISSSVRTSLTDRIHDPFAYDTPPTSFSNQGSGGLFATPVPNDKKDTSFRNRPLPPLPSETPNTFIQREIAQTRERLAARLAGETDNTDSFTKILEDLDRLLQPHQLQKRTVSAPPPKTPEYPGYLPMISESRAEDQNEFGKRSVTDPLKGRPGYGYTSRAAYTDYLADYTSTIRVVDPDSPTAVAPLNIRKKSGASNSNRSSAQSHDADGVKTVRWSGPTPMTRATTPTPTSKSNEERDATITKKKFWFRRHVSDKGPRDNEQQRHDSRLRIPEAWQGLDDRIKNGPPAPFGAPFEPTKKSTKRDSDTSSEFPIREERKPSKPDTTSGRRGGILGFFGKKSKEDRASRDMGMSCKFPPPHKHLPSHNQTNTYQADNHGSTSSLTSTGFDLASEDGKPPRRGDYQGNWLARFLHIKPLSRTLCFQIGRGRARAELVRLLRDWQRHGVRDVVFNRKTNVVHFRVDKTNLLAIKPVSVVCELFVVLEHGRRAQLCIARFTQTRGAASSFRKVIDTVEDIFLGRSMLVEDEEKKKGMAEVLG
jgi:hypothetical protein